MRLRWWWDRWRTHCWERRTAFICIEPKIPFPRIIASADQVIAEFPHLRRHRSLYAIAERRLREADARANPILRLLLHRSGHVGRIDGA